MSRSIGSGSMKSSKSVLAIQVPVTAARDEIIGTQGYPGAPVSRNRKLRLVGVSGLTDVATGATGSTTGDSSTAKSTPGD